MKFILFLLLLFGWTDSLSCDSVVIHGLSYHLRRNEQNEFNQGVGCRIFMGNEGHPVKWSIIGGIYNNSNRELSEYVVIARPFLTAGRWEFGGMAGFAKYEQWLPFVSPVISYRLNLDTSLNLGVVPADGGVFWFNFERKL